jgi:Ca-activated chloride channel homolog
VSFREPLLLVLLALVPLALVAYVLAGRRRRRYAVRYTNVPLLAGVAGRSWGRHVPPALALLALAALVLAVARPERTVAAEVQQGTVMMVTDTSGSMRATDVAPNRLVAAQRAARDFTDDLPDEFRLGLVSFSSAASQQTPPTTDRAQTRAAIDALSARGGTAMGDGLRLGLRAATSRIPDAVGGARRLPGAIVLLSDGKNTHGDNDPLEVARRARRERVPIYAVALGTANGVLQHTHPDGTTSTEPVPPDTDTLQEIARITGGRYFNVQDADRLESIYANLGTRLGAQERKEEVTVAFAGGGLVLLIVGGAMSLLWFGRLPS